MLFPSHRKSTLSPEPLFCTQLISFASSLQKVSLWCTTLGTYFPGSLSREQNRLFIWLMRKWDFNSVTEPSPCGHICMSTIYIWKPALLGTMEDEEKKRFFTHLTNSVVIMILQIAFYNFKRSFLALLNKCFSNLKKYISVCFLNIVSLSHVFWFLLFKLTNVRCTTLPKHKG